MHMKKSLLLKAVLPAWAASLLLVGCVVRERVVYRQPAPGTTVVTEAPASAEVVVTEAPPAPIVEEVVVAPGPGYVWIGGVWAWHGRWVWERGHWGRPPRRGATWVPHRYVYRNGAHVFVRGGWR